MSQGTIPFLSRRTHERWASGMPYHLTAIDHLESFIWVTLWAFLQRKEWEPSYTKITWLDMFTSPKPSVVSFFKASLLGQSSSVWNGLRMKGEIDPNMVNLFES